MSTSRSVAATAAQLLSVTREFRHFESIFLQPTATPARWRARVFDLEEELGFAGHPVLGAAAVPHDQAGGSSGTRRWTIELPAKTVTVQTTRDGTGFHAVLDQGRPEYGPAVTGAALALVLDGIGLRAADLAPGLAPAVVSTGLRYLTVSKGVTGPTTAVSRTSRREAPPGRWGPTWPGPAGWR